MKCREKLKRQYPKYIHSAYTGGCLGCPDQYGYLPKPEDCNEGNEGAVYTEEKCAACWDREIPEKNKEEV